LNRSSDVCSGFSVVIDILSCKDSFFNWRSGFSLFKEELNAK